MPKYVNVSGVWKQATEEHVNVNGVWKKSSDGFVNVSGVWKGYGGGGGPALYGFYKTAIDVINPDSGALMHTLQTPIYGGNDNHICRAPDNKIWFFSSGKVIRYIHGNTLGPNISVPGTTSWADSIYCNAHNLYVFDDEKCYKYDLNGNYLGTIVAEPTLGSVKWVCGVDNSGYIYTIQRAKYDMYIVKHDHAGRVINSIEDGQFDTHADIIDGMFDYRRNQLFIKIRDATGYDSYHFGLMNTDLAYLGEAAYGTTFYRGATYNNNNLGVFSDIYVDDARCACWLHGGMNIISGSYYYNQVTGYSAQSPKSVTFKDNDTSFAYIVANAGTSYVHPLAKCPINANNIGNAYGTAFGPKQDYTYVIYSK